MIDKKVVLIILIFSISFFSGLCAVSNAHNVSCVTSDDADFDTNAHMTANNLVIGMGDMI